MEASMEHSTEASRNNQKLYNVFFFYNFILTKKQSIKNKSKGKQ